MDRILVTRPDLPTLDEYIEEIRSIWATRWITNMGDKHSILKDRLRSYLNVENIELFTNGHNALELSLNVLNLSGEIITTPFTFISTTNSIMRNGLKPVFCDINEDDYTIDVSKIRTLITEKTCAIMPVHVYGNICDVDSIQDLADEYGIKVIYDAAHSFGEKINGIGIGNYGDISVFSFHATKVFNTIEGGASVFKDKELQQEFYSIKNFGYSKDNEEIINIGTNAKMNEFCAAMGLCNLRHIDDNIQKRKKINNIYEESLQSVKGIYITRKKKEVQYNYSYFPIRVNANEYGYSRDEIYDYLKKSNIYCRKYFYPLTFQTRCYSNIFSNVSTPVAQRVSEEILALPIYADLDEQNVANICDLIKRKRF